MTTAERRLLCSRSVALLLTVFVFCSFVLIVTSFCILIVDVECYCCTLSHARTHILGTTRLDKGSAHYRDVYLTTHNINKRQTSMPPARFEITIPASERPQTHTLGPAATGIGCCVSSYAEILIALCCFNSRLPCWFGIIICVHALRGCVSDKRGCSCLRPLFSSSVFHFPVLRSYCHLSLSTLFPSASNVHCDEAEAACCGRLCSLARVWTLPPFSGHGSEFE